jgi:5-methyltetrahydrofolate--homocysteine methyltransferase
VKPARFIVVGENIHCTRILKVGGSMVRQAADGAWHIAYRAAGGERRLPVPEQFRAGADWEAGRLKHCAVAIWQGMYGGAADRDAGIEYIRHLALRQQEAGAAYLDVNVDEFSTDEAERAKAARWTVTAVQEASSLPVSVDSSNTRILRAGLEACDPARGRPMVNSVSLERADAIRAAADHRAAVIASAAGEKGLPSSVEERMANIRRLVAMLDKAGFDRGAMHVDPLVFPISTDSGNGRRFLETVTRVRQEYGPQIHIVAGLSNVSFGMPGRKLINQVFAALAIEAGADGGIVDPMQINPSVLAALDPASEPFKLARALLLGEDEFGMNYIAACREEKI